MLDGSLARRCYHQEPAIQALWDPTSEWMTQSQKDFAPVIYIRPLVDRKGQAPTPTEMTEVASALRDHASGQDLGRALKIDRALQSGVSPSIEELRAGKHRYLASSKVRVQKVLAWCAATMKRCEAVPQEAWGLPKPPTHCGYTTRFKRRNAQYISRSSTTWLVLHVEAAFETSRSRD
jgi:hypothetical protein